MMSNPAFSPLSQSLSLNASLLKSASYDSLPSCLPKEDAWPRVGGGFGGGASRIDYSKYKTKLCRHFVRGLPCPFRERCVFAHGEEVAKMGMRDLASTPASPMGSKTGCCYSPEADSMTPEERSTSSVEGSGEFQVRSGSTTMRGDVSVSLPLPPPSYESAVVMEEGTTAPEDFLPPTYPRRYRFDPYSAAAIVYVVE